jgi:hypothetical protein
VASLNRQWRQTEGDSAWAMFRTDSSNWSAFDAAVDAANDLAIQRESSAMGQFPAPVPNGYVVCISEAESVMALAQWVDDCARALEERGLSGELGSTRPAPAFAVLNSSPTADEFVAGTYRRGSQATAFIASAVDLDAMATDPLPQGHWQVPRATTEALVNAVANWAATPDATVVLHHNLFAFVADGPIVPPGLTRALTTTGHAGVDYVSQDKATARHVQLGPPGETVAQILGPKVPPHTRLEALRSLLLCVPEHIEHGFIRQAHDVITDSMHVFDALPGPPDADEATFRYSPHLRGEYVRDAHGIQVLRSGHLKRARDLSEWTITSLGHDRHLVEAIDLDPWYAQETPDPDVLAKARHDFGVMILTEETARANPPPW